ncbi:phosphoglycerate mutase-like protein [Microthyrium microscopicum]|uniref:Phosphoglycerate mutase-like protein n=1 Tax=Microthyrium microscopicum TaxID=703497 RepID=A0A6A6U9J0_9PEZI|nr:phosphoglycerate mutase-like protein [Microthyrium microscopicum]
MIERLSSRILAVIASAVLLLDSAQHGARAQGITGQANETTQYTVYATFIYARTGERTPQLIPDQELTLTSFGAQQMYNLGGFFRDRYIGTGISAPAYMPGLNTNLYSDDQMSVLAPDWDFTTKSALAFMQAFYPPYRLNSSGGELDPTAIMASNNYLDWPSGGTQLPLIQTYSIYSPERIWIDGEDNCLNGDISRSLYYNSSTYVQNFYQSLDLYKKIGPLFAGTNIDTSEWSYGEGWSIYELLEYENRHNSTIAAALSSIGAYNGYLELLSGQANSKLWDLYGNTSTVTSTNGAYISSPILTMGGQTLAAKILGMLQSSIENNAFVNKVTFVAGEFYPMLSLFSLLGLGDFNSRFQELPPYGSAIVVEVFSSLENPPPTPDPSNLYVRFLFRNGSDPTSSNAGNVSPDLVAFPMFHRGPSGTDMSWNDFQTAMQNIQTGSVLDWCTQCQAQTLFCIPFLDDSSSTTASGKKHISPAVGGVIGAIVTLAIAGILVGLLMLFGGLRFYKNPKSGKKSALGGFKGSAKLHSDADLNIPKNGAPIGISVQDVGTTKKGHERVGSWELNPSGEEKDNETSGAGFHGQGHQRFTSLGSTVVDRPSFEEDDGDDHIGMPVRPRESV